MFKYLFAPPDSFEACGMFTLPHIISLILCILLICVALYFSRNISDSVLRKITIIFAYVFSVMEIIKIIYKFAVKDTYQLDFWLPLSFCSLFIYSLLAVAYGRGIVKTLGLSFIVGGGFTGGLAFLIVPSTSLMANPIFHYLSIHSMLFHSCMIYMCFMYMLRGAFKLTLKNYKYYFVYIFSVCIICLILNLIFKANLMVIASPVNIPVKIVNVVAERVPWVYTCFAVFVYVTIPYFVSMGIEKVVHVVKNKEKA